MMISFKMRDYPLHLYEMFVQKVYNIIDYDKDNLLSLRLLCFMLGNENRNL